MAADKPLVSFLLFAYNQEKFIRDAVHGALAQTYEPLEIILSDDCSPDRTFDIIQEEANAYRGPHKIVLNRNEKNLGLAAHINRVFEMAKGQFFIGAAGDDISVPERTESLVSRWLNKSAPVDMVCSFFEEIGVQGKPTGFIKKETVFTPDTAQPVRKWKCGATGACVGYSRKIYDKYGPLDSRIIAEDWVLSFRAWLESGIALIEEPLVKHRSHGQNISELHKNIKNELDSNIRQELRRKGAEGTLARALEWQRAWKLAQKSDVYNAENQFSKWIELLQCEVTAYDGGRFGALLSAIKSLRYPGGMSSAIRIIARNVLRYQ